MGKKRIILSFDYELFFGDKSGTVQRTLIQPTNLLLDQMDSVGFKGNFFVDYMMLKYLALENDERCKDDYQAIVEQLKDMIRRGHRAELHIHPHWVDAKYKGDGTWNFKEFRHYGLDSFKYEEVTDMFVEGTQLLEAIAHKVDPTYKIIAFRAGGWAVQPFEMLVEGFKKTGIKIDSSVAKGVAIEKDNTIVDFTKAPSKCLYRFSSDVCREDANGCFIEVPISIYHRDYITSLLSYISGKKRKKVARIPDGSHFRSSDSTTNTKTVLQRQGLPAMFSLDNLPLRTWIKTVLFKDDLMCFIDHPKDFNQYTLNNIKQVTKCGKSITYNEILQNC